jgi:hypothetical protein
MKFLLVLVFVMNGRVIHESIPVETMNECTSKKQVITREFREGAKKDHKLLAATCRVNPQKKPTGSIALPG